MNTDTRPQTEQTSPSAQGAKPRRHRMAREPKAETITVAKASPHPSKIASVIALLERDQGANLAEMVDATGWKPHTTRAALTGLTKKGHVLAKDKRGDVTCYRIVKANG